MPDATPACKSWVAAIHASADDLAPLGTAVVIDDRRVLTCAHVLNACNGEWWVAFPMTGDPCAARLRGVRVRRAENPTADLAVVELDEPIPAGVAAAQLRCPKPDDVVNRAWWAFGFADHDPHGNEAHGQVGASLGHGWVQLDRTSRYPVEPGFSGSGLWCPDYDAVVGIVAHAHPNGDGRAVTLHLADKRLPAEKIRDLARWRLSADKEADRHWRPRSRGVSVVSERGHRFCGRRSALTEIVTWLNRAAPDLKVLVITSSPGVGKSAVLGRIVTTADAETRAALPPGDDAPRASVGSVACAVHAKGKTALDVAMEIARAASAPLPEEVEDFVAALREVLAGAVRRFNLVIDALDEASDPTQASGIIKGIVLPIAQTCADVGAQVIVGTRRGDDSGELLRIFGPACSIVDLDDTRYFALDDLAAYAQATLQLRGDERRTNPYQSDDVAAPVAVRIAELAERNFLIAGLVARTHGLYDDAAISPAAISFTPSVASTLGTFLDRLAPIGEVTAGEVLTSLAFAEAPGLPAALWQLALRTLTGAEISIEQLARFARGSAANFLIESTDESATATFRLFHQALSDALSAERGRSVSPQQDEEALSRAFTGYGARIGWDHAPTYLFRSLPGHAARAGIIDELIADTDYVLHADLRRLITAAMGVRMPTGLERAHLLRLTPQAISAEAPERLALLSVTEALHGCDTAFRRHRKDTPYRALWANAPRRMDRVAADGHTGGVRGVCAVEVDGRELLASASVDATVRIWDPTTGTTKHVLDGHVNWVNAVCAVQVAGRELLASASDDATVRIWDPATGTTERTLKGHIGGVNGVCAVQVAGRELLASASEDGTVRIWDPATGTTERVISEWAGAVNGVCAVRVADCELLASASNDAKVRLWDPATGTSERVLAGYPNWVRGVCPVRVAGRELLALASDDHTVRVWDPTTGTTERTLEGHTNWVRGLCPVWLAGRELLASASGDTTVRVWDPATGTTERTLEGHTSWVTGVCAVRVAGRELLASASGDTTVRVWDPATGTTERTLEGHTDGVNGVCMVRVAGRELLASASGDTTVRVWDPATGTTKRILEGHTNWVNGVCMVRAAGQELLASASDDRTVRIWDPATGHPLQVIPVRYEAFEVMPFNDDHLVVGLSAGLLALTITSGG
ncbi:MAG: trypsin-like peptidase domain-containing protein [Pseudonocardiaceae bacterium]